MLRCIARILGSLISGLLALAECLSLRLRRFARFFETSQPAASSLRDVRGYINVLSCAASPLLRALAPEEPPRPGFRSHLIAIGPNWAPMSIRGRSQGFLKASARTTSPSEHVSSALQGITSLPAASRQQ